jgi:hypothetical protein
MRILGRVRVNDMLLHFSAYVLPSSLPVIGFGFRQRGIFPSATTFVLASLIEVTQHFSTGRSVDAANGAGVGCCVLLASFIGKLIAILCAAANSLTRGLASTRIQDQCFDP